MTKSSKDNLIFFFRKFNNTLSLKISHAPNFTYSLNLKFIWIEQRANDQWVWYIVFTTILRTKKTDFWQIFATQFLSGKIKTLLMFCCTRCFLNSFSLFLIIEDLFHDIKLSKITKTRKNYSRYSIVYLI